MLSSIKSIHITRGGQPVCSLPIDEKTIYKEQLMILKEITCSAISSAPLPIAINDYIIYDGEEFAIEEQWGVIEKDGLFFYTIIFEYDFGKLRRKKIKDEKGRKTFSYYGDAQNYLQLIVDNINQIVSGYSVGKVDLAGEQHIEFDGDDCRSALFKIAEAFKLEFYAEGKKIHLVKQVGKDLDVTFEQGMGNGLYELELQTLDNTGIVTRLFGYGGTKNIAPSYRDNIGQLVFGARYIDRNTDLYGIREDDFTDETIFPRRTGTVSATASLLSFTDETINFDLNDCFLENEQAMITPNTGDLTGVSLNIRSYDHSTKTVYLEEKKDGDYALPSDTRKLQIGNEYVFTGIKMPQSYNDDAETDLYLATDAASAEYAIPRVSYGLAIDEKFIRDNEINLRIGDRPFVKSTKLGINNRLRVTDIEFPLVNPDNIKATVGNVVVYQSIDRIAVESKKNARAIKQVANQVSAVKPVIGAYLSFRGDYDSTVDYYGGKNRIEVIKYQGEYYHAKINAGTFKGYTPTNNLKWNKFDGQFESLATGLLLAELAYIENLGVRFLSTDEPGQKRFVVDGSNNKAYLVNDADEAVLLIDDTGSFDGVRQSNIPPIDSPDGSPDPDYMYSKVVQVNGVDVLQYFYAVRSAGVRVGLSPLNSAGFASFGQKGFYTTGKVEASYNGQGIRFDKDGFTANGSRTKSGHVMLANNGSTYRVLSVVNGLIMGVIDSLPVAEYTPLIADPTNPLPANDTNDTGYDPESSAPGGGSGSVDPPTEEPIDPPAEPPAGSPTTLLEAGFPLGFMIKSGTLNNANNRASLIAHAVGITPENDYKNVVKSFDPATGAYTTDFSETDPQVIWAKANGKKFHIHTGHWPNHTASWEAALENNPLMTTQKWWDLLKIKIQAPLLHLKNDPALDGVADSYDVLNEIFLNSNDTASGTLRYKEDVYLRKLGPGYYKQALRWAREADPRIKLFVNEVNFEYGGYKVENMLAFAGESKTENFPLDGWGLQYHQNCKISSTPTSGTRKNLKLLSDTVDHIHLSEVALSLRYNPYYVSGQPFVLTPEMELLQAQKYLALMRYFVLDIPKSKQYRFTTWGIIDPDYMGADEEEFAMLLKADHSRKLAYDYMLNEMIQINSQQELPL